MSFLGVEGKNYLISGLSNKKSVAFFVAKTLKENGANLFFTVQSDDHKKRCEKLFPESEIFIVDVENKESMISFSKEILSKKIKLDGLLHSIAFANYAKGVVPFHDTEWEDFQQAYKISCFSLVELSGLLKDSFSVDASVVTVSISNTKVASYGYMGPVKAALEGSISYLANSFSKFSKVRFNAVCSGPLKTSASAGIPGYIDNYLYSEQLTLRKESLKTQEVGNSIVFLLSKASSGINGTGLLIDAGMSVNYFDEKVVQTMASHL